MSARRFQIFQNFQRFQQSSFRYLVVVAAIFASNSFPEHSFAQETPMTFVQRRDVSEEIRASTAQLVAARSLGEVCDEACQQRMQQTLQNLDPSFFQQFQALSAEDREQLATTANRENRETVEMEILEDNILDPLQMVRFNQLWQQNLGVGALTSPATTQLLNMSPQQINQIQQFQNDATAMINACQANPNMTNAQKNAFITNINNITIDNSISTYDYHSFIAFNVYYDYGRIIDSSCLLYSLPPFSFSLLFSSFEINLLSPMATQAPLQTVSSLFHLK